jgi:hypothetical protein
MFEQLERDVHKELGAEHTDLPRLKHGEGAVGSSVLNIRSWNNPLDPDLVEDRRVAVQQFINNLVERPAVLSCTAFMEFLLPGEAVVAAEAAVAGISATSTASAEQDEGSVSTKREVVLPEPVGWMDDWLSPAESVSALWEDEDVLAQDLAPLAAPGQIHPFDRQRSSLNQLVTRLTSIRQQEPEFEKVFLATYRSFTTPSVLLTKLWQRFSVPLDDTILESRAMGLPGGLGMHRKMVAVRVVKFIQTWIQQYFHIDFFSDSQLQAQLRGAIEALRAEDQAMMGPQCDRALKIWQEVGAEGLGSSTLQFSNNATRARTVPPPQPLKPASRNPSWLDYDELEIARQMTLMDWDVYCQLKPHELLGRVRGDSVVAKSVRYLCMFTSLSGAQTTALYSWSKTRAVLLCRVNTILLSRWRC